MGPSTARGACRRLSRRRTRASVPSANRTSAVPCPTMQRPSGRRAGSQGCPRSSGGVSLSPRETYLMVLPDRLPVSARVLLRAQGPWAAAERAAAPAHLRGGRSRRSTRTLVLPLPPRASQPTSGAPLLHLPRPSQDVAQRVLTPRRVVWGCGRLGGGPQCQVTPTQGTVRPLSPSAAPPGSMGAGARSMPTWLALPRPPLRLPRTSPASPVFLPGRASHTLLESAAVTGTVCCYGTEPRFPVTPRATAGRQIHSRDR